MVPGLGKEGDDATLAAGIREHPPQPGSRPLALPQALSDSSLNPGTGCGHSHLGDTGEIDTHPPSFQIRL